MRSEVGEGLIPACDVVRMARDHNLAEQNEQLVRNHIETTRKAAVAAVERAFSATPLGTRLWHARDGSRG